MPPSQGGNSLDRLNAALAGRYLLERVLGRGGMATVYLADDLRHDRRVAVKIIHSELADAVAAERFLREIRIAAQLTHPNIIPLLDSGVVEIPPEPPRAFYVMPYVEGDSLRERLRREGNLPVEEAIQIAREVVNALDYAHRQGVIHRDIKPENILMVAGRPVVADFGIARFRGSSSLTMVSSGALALGTPFYMSPEQWSADPQIDGRTDIYSVGCVLYEMLAGEPPFTGPTVEAIRARHAAELPRPLKTIRPSVPDRVMSVISRSMAKQPADRFQSAGDLATALAGDGAPPRRRVSRGTLIQVVAAAAVVLAVGLVLGTVWFSRGPPLDSNRFVVLPLREGIAGRVLVSGQAAGLAVDEALGRFHDVALVDRQRVSDALSREGHPATLGDALAIARSLGAGRLVWGDVGTSRDTTWVHATLYDVRRRENLGNAREPLVAGQLSGVFDRLVDSLIGRLLGPVAGGSVSGTRSFAALEAFTEAHRALAEWDLSTAESQLRAAIQNDPGYPHANLQLGQVRQWLRRPPAEWRPFVAAALRGASRLSPADSGLGAALLELADGNYPQACVRFRRLLERDSLDFSAWLGLGDCQVLDSLVIPDPGSPSGWQFRSSYRNALNAYETALTLVPSVHLAYQGAAFNVLENLLYTADNRFRLGRLEGAETPGFAAFPSLQADTLAFLPWPERDVLNAVPRAMPPSRHEALMRNRRLLRGIASRWLTAFPGSVPALRAFAHMVESSGDLGDEVHDGPSALSAVRRIRAMTGDTGLAFAAWEVRLRVKRGEFTAARLLADSLLRRSAQPSASAAKLLAGLAALTGRVHQAADLYARSAPQHEDFSPFDVPLPVGMEVLRLMGYAAFGAPAESLLVMERRVLDQIDGYASATERARWRQVLLERPAQLAFPVLAGPDSGNYILMIEAALRRGDTAQALAQFEAIRQIRFNQPPGSVTIDMALLESRLLVAGGDRQNAAAMLDRRLGALSLLGMDLLEQVEQAAAVGRAMALRARLAEAAGDRLVAERWRRAVTDLWAGADPEVRSELRGR